MWSMLLRLLQDEDEHVRQRACQSVEFFTSLDSSVSSHGNYLMTMIMLM